MYTVFITSRDCCHRGIEFIHVCVADCYCNRRETQTQKPTVNILSSYAMCCFDKLDTSVDLAVGVFAYEFGGLNTLKNIGYPLYKTHSLHETPTYVFIPKKKKFFSMTYIKTTTKICISCKSFVSVFITSRHESSMMNIKRSK